MEELIEINHIKTCFGEWVNLELVKHFSVKHKEDYPHDYQLACADGIVLRQFKIEYELPPEDPAAGWGKESWKLTDEERLLQNEYQENARKIANNAARSARAKACAWLADVIKTMYGKTAKLNWCDDDEYEKEE